MEINLKNKNITLATIKKFCNGRNDVIKFVDDHGSMILDAETKAAEEETKPDSTKAKTKRK